MSEVIVKWEGNMKFVGIDEAGRQVAMDASQIYGGMNQGVRPMELLLMALGGCSGIELAHILKKMRVQFDSLLIEVEGKRAEDHPKVFENINIVYKLTGPNLPPEKVYHALKLTDEKYCSVSNMVNKAAAISYAFELNGTRFVYPAREE
ncbi:OsmC family protein [Desulfofundulus thermocisternus]|jgi:putative redox protein|uniref:OsmC family protein n=1 Tax=Desulfofundulus thermocisternus TaxID=42471 RepID=UPI00217D111A|nr:OsmC family protein [Desulfofundulus thermocisternus]MCS5697138.1 OsmC family protein [Desulfofundulus thermocisternus]